MDIYESVLAKELGTMLLTYTKQIDVSALASRCDAACRLALNEIRAVLDDEALSDFDCIEKIVCILERCGGGGGSRHDFG